MYLSTTSPNVSPFGCTYPTDFNSSISRSMIRPQLMAALAVAKVWQRLCPPRLTIIRKRFFIFTGFAIFRCLVSLSYQIRIAHIMNGHELDLRAMNESYLDSRS
jgi:hypothetical protein